MEKIKYCPKCRKQYGFDQEVCECGYEFVKIEDKNKVFTEKSTPDQAIRNDIENL